MHASTHRPLLCLASASPRRHELLRQIGVHHRACAADIDEAVLPGERAADYVVRMARAKALSVHAHSPALPVLGADTIVLIDVLILGKPAGAAEGVAMLEHVSPAAPTKC